MSLDLTKNLLVGRLSSAPALVSLCINYLSDVDSYLVVPSTLFGQSTHFMLCKAGRIMVKILTH